MQEHNHGIPTLTQRFINEEIPLAYVRAPTTANQRFFRNLVPFIRNNFAIISSKLYDLLGSRIQSRTSLKICLDESHSKNRWSLISTSFSHTRHSGEPILSPRPANTALNKHSLQNGVKKIKKIMSKKGERCEGDVEELIMIDVIQRLGLEYYFQEDIEGALKRHHAYYYHTTMLGDNNNGFHNLHEVALRFRLLRQGGYDPSVGTFMRFKNNEGKYKEEYCKDIKGLISLFEASQLSIQGDDILDDDGEFSKKLLQHFIKTEEQFKATVIRNILSHPFQRSLPRLMGKSFLLDFENSLKVLHDCQLGTYGWSNDIQDIARMEFNMAQITHQDEIVQVSRWWKQLGLNDVMKLARNQPTKWYLWSLAALPNPCANEERIYFTRPISLVYIVDDIFDVYGTLDELTIFTNAVNQWEYPKEKLPHYMNMCLKALYEATNEISGKVFAKHGWNPIESLKKAWAELCNCSLIEAKWLISGELPGSEEYLKNGIITSGIPLVLVHLLYLLGQGIDNRNAKGLNNFEEVIEATATILRLLDDLGSAKDENQNGQDGSYIDCYMKEHQGSSSKDAECSLNKKVSDAWKCLNQKCFLPPSFSLQTYADFIKACLNVARMVPMMYSYDDNQNLPDLQRHMKLFLNEKIN